MTPQKCGVIFYAPKDKENLPGFDPGRFGMKD
jgi:hypothetical protein